MGGIAGPQPMAARRSAEDAEAAVQRQHAHFSLITESYESKSLPATWRCSIHNVEFRYPASALSRPGSLGCPECKEERERAKRRKQYAGPDLERHVPPIRERFGDDYATIWRMRSEGMKLEKIGVKFGLSDQSICQRISRIKRVLGGHQG